ncbi:MAG: hypothetical protein ABRQ38_30235 [Candidatus Eremiobacterota bacterium]
MEKVKTFVVIMSEEEPEEKSVKEESVLTPEEIKEMCKKNESNLYKKSEELSELKQEVFINMCQWVNECYKRDVASNSANVTANTIEATKIILGTPLYSLVFS